MFELHSPVCTPDQRKRAAVRRPVGGHDVFGDAPWTAGTERRYGQRSQALLSRAHPNTVARDCQLALAGYAEDAGWRQVKRLPVRAVATEDAELKRLSIPRSAVHDVGAIGSEPRRLQLASPERQLLEGRWFARRGRCCEARATSQPAHCRDDHDGGKRRKPPTVDDGGRMTGCSPEPLTCPAIVREIACKVGSRFVAIGRIFRETCDDPRQRQRNRRIDGRQRWGLGFDNSGGVCSEEAFAKGFLRVTIS